MGLWWVLQCAAESIAGGCIGAILGALCMAALLAVIVPTVLVLVDHL